MNDKLRTPKVGEEVFDTTTGKAVVEEIGESHVSIRSTERQTERGYIVLRIDKRHLAGYGWKL